MSALSRSCPVSVPSRVRVLRWLRVAGAQVLEFHSEAVDSNLLGGTWLPALPLDSDEAEAAVAHEQLVRLVEGSDPMSPPPPPPRARTGTGTLTSATAPDLHAWPVGMQALHLW